VEAYGAASGPDGFNIGTPTAARGFIHPTEKYWAWAAGRITWRVTDPTRYDAGPAPALRPGERLLTPADVAAALQVSRATVYALVERGELRARRVELQLRILGADLEAFLRTI